MLKERCLTLFNNMSKRDISSSDQMKDYLNISFKPFRNKLSHLLLQIYHYDSRENKWILTLKFEIFHTISLFNLSIWVCYKVQVSMNVNFTILFISRSSSIFSMSEFWHKNIYIIIKIQFKINKKYGSIINTILIFYIGKFS